MSRPLKLGLDLVFGLVIPIFILSRLSETLGAVPAYLLAALVPVGWVAVDLLFITKRFNFITTFLGLNAVLRGILAFWFVDGILYALKDSAPSLLWVLVFGGSLVAGRPLLYHFSAQALDPRTERQSQLLRQFFSERPIRRSLWVGTAILTGVSVVSTLANFFLNLAVVTASFGTDAFNAQVAQANAIARVAIAIPEAAAMGVVIMVVFRAIYAKLPDEQGEEDFWELVEAREAR